jgi:hypothetical protein
LTNLEAESWGNSGGNESSEVVANDHGLTVASVVNNRHEKPDEVANR